MNVDNACVMFLWKNVRRRRGENVFFIEGSILLGQEAGLKAS